MNSGAHEDGMNSGRREDRMDSGTREDRVASGRQVLVRHEPGLENHPAFAQWTECVREALAQQLGAAGVTFHPAEPHQHPRVFLGGGFETADRTRAEAAVASVETCDALLASHPVSQPAAGNARQSLA